MVSLAIRATVVGNGTSGSAPALLLTACRRAQWSDEETPLEQLLINCGECSCRIINEGRSKLSNLAAVLLTSARADTLSGIPSLLFHLSDRGGSALSIVGVGGVGAYVAAAQSFVCRQFPTTTIVECDDDEEVGLPVVHNSTLPARDAASGFSGAARDPFAIFRSRSPGAGVTVTAIPYRAAPAADSDVAGSLPREAKRSRMGEPAAPETPTRSSPDRACYRITCEGPARHGGRAHCDALIVEPHDSSDSAACAAALCARMSAADRCDLSVVFHLGPEELSCDAGYREAWVSAVPGAAHHFVSARGSDAALFPSAARLLSRLATAEPCLVSHHSQSSCDNPLAAPTTTRSGGGGDEGALRRGGWVPLAACDSIDLPSLVVCTAAAAELPADARTLDESSTSSGDAFAALPAISLPPLLLYPGLPPTVSNYVTAAAVAVVASAATSIVAPTGMGSTNQSAAASMRSLLRGGAGAAAVTVAAAAAAAAATLSLVAVPSSVTAAAAAALPTAPVAADPSLPFLVFLGTGAAAPSKFRSCSGVLVCVPASPTGGRATRGCLPDTLLLDCGEGCVSKLVPLSRTMAAASTASSASPPRCHHSDWHALLLRIGVVWISHMHADHHTGLFSLLAARAAAQACAVCSGPPPASSFAAPSAAAAATWGGGACGGGPLLVVGPAALQRLLAAYVQLLGVYGPHVVDFRSIISDAAPRPPPPTPPCIASLSSIPVHHCHDAYGAVVTLRLPPHSAGGALVLVYSGDTRPCTRLCEAAAGAAAAAADAQWHGGGGGGPTGVLLIHEATMNDDRQADAAKKRHCTVGEAVGVAHQLRGMLQWGQQQQQQRASCYMGTVLTHFSQRYPAACTIGGGGAAAAGPAAAAVTEPPLAPPPLPYTLFAFDGLRLPLALPQLGHVMAHAPAIMGRISAAALFRSGGGGKDVDADDD